MSCPDCVTGTIHEGKPLGTEIKVGDINAYAVGPEDSHQVIVMGADVFGWKFVNTRLLADEYAAKLEGARVILPDLFNGAEIPQWTLSAHDPMNERPSLFTRFVAVPTSLFILVPFILRNSSRQTTLIPALVTALRAAHGPAARIGFVGYCWGGRFAFTQNSLFDATVACHPSLVKFPAELGAIKHPFSLAVAETDRRYDRAQAEETEKILKGKGLTDVEVVVYEGVKHGWTTRANLADGKQKKGRDEVVAQVVGWFRKYLSTPGEVPAVPAADTSTTSPAAPGTDTIPVAPASTTDTPATAVA